MENREKAGVGQYPRLVVLIDVPAHTFVHSFIMSWYSFLKNLKQFMSHKFIMDVLIHHELTES